jgi:hypothetical protein
MATESVINQKADNQSDHDKSSGEDHIMRLHEFANPKDYNLPKPELPDPSELIGTIRRDDKADDAEPRLSTRSIFRTTRRDR